MLFGAGPYGHPASGTPGSLPRIVRDDLVALHAARFRPDNAVLVLAGDLDAATALTPGEQTLRHLENTGRRALAAVPSGRWPPMPLAFAVIDMPKSGQAAVVVVLPIPDNERDRAARDVMNAVLGGGYSSRLNEEIRIKRGLSYGAGSGIDARPRGGVLRVAVQTKNESAAEVVALVQAELDGLIAAPVPTEELGARKATLIGGFSRSVETTAGLTGALRSLVVTGRSPAELQHAHRSAQRGERRSGAALCGGAAFGAAAGASWWPAKRRSSWRRSRRATPASCLSTKMR